MLKTLLTWLFTFSMLPNSQAGVGNWMETCPAGYVLVPKNSQYVDQNFCVMKYEARARNDSTGVIDADGCNEAGCTTLDWGTAANSPVSDPSNLPWRKISRNAAVTECQSLGPRYDLITNAESQTIARNLENVAANWTGGVVGTGCMFQGNNGHATCGYDGANPEGGTGRNTRARLFLSNGQEIWDFAGNVNEWQKDLTTFSYGADASALSITTATHPNPGMLDDGVARVAKNQLGPAGTSYSCAASANCGFGFQYLSTAGGALLRGGQYTDTTASGVFMVYPAFGPSGGNADHGFRCVYRPVDPCKLSKYIQPGTRCGGQNQATTTQLFVGSMYGYDYFTTPSGCTNSSTPTCAGGTDSVTTVWRGLSGSNVDIGDISNVVGVATPSSPTESGERITPAMVAHTSITSESPGHYCSNMTYAGFTDWFLPSKSETSFLYCAASSGSHNTSMPEDVPDCYTMGGKRNLMTGFATTDGYWASTEAFPNVVWSIMMNTGAQSSDLKSNAGFQRCMRRELSRDPCAGNPARGTTCRGGAIYAGKFDGGKYMVTPSGCTDHASPICAGGADTVTKIWRGSTGSNADVAGLTNNTVQASPSLSTERGHVTTPILINDASISSDSAADYCANMVYGGYSDWYLGSKSEMGYLYCKTSTGSHNTSWPHEDPNCVAFGGKTSELTGFNTFYWTSSENQSTIAWWQNMSTGGQYGDLKTQNYGVRCIRRYDQVTIPRLVNRATSPSRSASPGSVTVTSTTAGNLMAVAVVMGANYTVTGITDNATGGSNTYVSASARATYAGGAVEIWYAKNIKAGATTVTATLSGCCTNGYALHAFEISGASTTNPLDAAAVLNNGTAGTAVNGPALTTNAAETIIISSVAVATTVSSVNAPFVGSIDANANASAYAMATSGAQTITTVWNLGTSGAYTANSVSFRADPEYIVLNSGSAWQVPADWDNSNNSIEVIGGGGGGGMAGTAFANNPGSGGGGGGYSKVTNVTLTPGASIAFRVGGGGLGATTLATAGAAGGDTYLCNSMSNCSSISDSAVIVGAKGGGGGGVKAAGGTGGASASGVGSVKYNGGNGGSTALNGNGGGGGGGAGGPNGNGGNGGNIASSGGGGTGGGGSGGGGNAVANVGDNFSVGAMNFYGTGGGSTTGAPGFFGGGGAGANDSVLASPHYGGAGGAGREFGAVGAGGGGGGGGWTDNDLGGGDGGLYGGGGGGGAPGNNPGGDGAPGLIIIRYGN